MYIYKEITSKVIASKGQYKQWYQTSKVVRVKVLKWLRIFVKILMYSQFRTDMVPYSRVNNGNQLLAAYSIFEQQGVVYNKTADRECYLFLTIFSFLT